jgi:hypothetical protein
MYKSTLLFSQGHLPSQYKPFPIIFGHFQVVRLTSQCNSDR